MQIFEDVFLGIIQGLTEFIPISSSGHLVIAQSFFSGASDHLFLEFINIGTLLALVIFFRKRIFGIFRDIFINKKYKLALNVLVTAVPAGVAGLMLSDFINHSVFFISLTTVAITLAIVGVLMIVLDKIAKKPNIEDGEKLSTWRAFVIGLAQVFALIPGVSRSGSTIIAGRLSGLSSAAAAEYSFLVSIPIMFGVSLKLLVSDQQYFYDNLQVILISNLAAFVAGLFAIGFLMKYLSRRGLAVFGWYRVGLAAILSVVILLQ